MFELLFGKYYIKYVAIKTKQKRNLFDWNQLLLYLQVKIPVNTHSSLYYCSQKIKAVMLRR